MERQPQPRQSRAAPVERDLIQLLLAEPEFVEPVKVEVIPEQVAHPGLRRMLEGILAVEEEHADDLASFLADLDKDWKTRDRSAG